MTSEQNIELQAYWEMKKQLLEIIYLLTNEGTYSNDEMREDVTKVLAIVDVREKEAMSAITAAYTASVSHFR
ncbi:hypothetical protein BK124_00555 [Paenibacillus amylolyticus]|uniref:hypothetical protein n=1 Tax=Paenibacillus amylolyticus TaxID=1451 RepID=UPI00096E8587|nr:hypothetical protein [Paenibacillus amylolyticus]OMF01203.1 hypothetical protein BK124_00555 [Paenibacillus amylolyticus]